MQNFETPIKSLIDRRTRIRLELLKARLNGDDVSKGIDLNIHNSLNDIAKTANTMQRIANQVNLGMARQMNMSFTNVVQDAVSNVNRFNVEFIQAMSKDFTKGLYQNVFSDIDRFSTISLNLVPTISMLENISFNLLHEMQSTANKAQKILRTINLDVSRTFYQSFNNLYNVSSMMTRPLFYRFSMLTIDDIEDDEIDFEQLKKSLMLSAAHGVVYFHMFVMVYTAVTDTNLFALLYSVYENPIQKASKKYIEDNKKSEED